MTISLSNLLKQHYVIGSNSEKRIINANAILEERMKLQVENEANDKGGNGLRFRNFDQEESEEADDFQGLEVPVIEVEPEISTEEVQTVIFNNLSKRLAVMIREDMEFMGPVRLKDVE